MQILQSLRKIIAFFTSKSVILNFFQERNASDVDTRVQEEEAEDSRPFHSPGECERSRSRTPSQAGCPDHGETVNFFFFIIF